MKKTIVALTFAMLPISGALADGYTDPVVEPIVIQQAAAQDSMPSAQLVMILATLTVFGAALSH
ncbi:hypothetical protein [Primorskyibacter sp. 2E233]|uniref:hypothetical protein n=1 Tax=Primorskyibacter sp. 2E233 TaxID=3413431 RepID=UPI003BF13C17